MESSQPKSTSSPSDEGGSLKLGLNPTDVDDDFVEEDFEDDLEKEV